MESGKIASGKSDSKSAANMLPVSASSLKVGQSKFMTRNINGTQSQSKIPKREVGKPPEAKKPPRNMTTKSIESKKSSKSLMHLDLPKTARPRFLCSARSNLNTQRSEQTPRLQISERSSLKQKKESASERAAARNKSMVFESAKKKLGRCQKDELSPKEGECKLIGFEKNNNAQLVTENAQKFKIKCDAKDLDDLKIAMTSYAHNNYKNFLNYLDQLKSSSEKIGDNPVPNIIEDARTDYLKALDEVLAKIESCEACDKPAETPRSSELEVKVKNLLKQTDERRKELEESQNELSRIKKIEADKANLYKKNLEEKDNLFRGKTIECDELRKKLESLEKSVSSDKTSHRELQEKLNNKTVEVDDLKIKLKTSTESNVLQQSKSKEQEKLIKELEAELSTVQKDAEKRIEHCIRDQANKYADKIKALEEMLKNTNKEKDALAKDVQRLKKESEKLSETAAQHLKFKDEAQRSDAENQTLRQAVKDLESKLQNIENQAGVSKVDQDELENLQKSNTAKNTKIEDLDLELSKARFHIKQLEEKIVMDRKLLKVRSSLIESLQTKETTQKLRLEDLFVEVGERKGDLQMLKTELVTKTEEFKNLFSTLGTKQLELTRQEHMIKLLQESNERAQTLRVKQEAKIGRLEEEVAHLKQTISLYQQAMLPNNELTKNLLMIELSRDDDLNENLGYYVDERRRKRHVDINVKKYEK